MIARASPIPCIIPQAWFGSVALSSLTPLLNASATVGQVLKPGDLVIYESTVYPGCTEEDCAPVLEKWSGLKYAASPSPQPSPTRGEGARGFTAATGGGFATAPA